MSIKFSTQLTDKPKWKDVEETSVILLGSSKGKTTKTKKRSKRKQETVQETQQEHDNHFAGSAPKSTPCTRRGFRRIHYQPLLLVLMFSVQSKPTRWRAGSALGWCSDQWGQQCLQKLSQQTKQKLSRWQVQRQSFYRSQWISESHTGLSSWLQLLNMLT